MSAFLFTEIDKVRNQWVLLGLPIPVAYVIRSSKT